MKKIKVKYVSPTKNDEVELAPKVNLVNKSTTAWKVSKYGVISGSYFPALGLNTDRSSIVCEVITKVFFLYKAYFKPKIHKTITSN